MNHEQVKRAADLVKERQSVTWMMERLAAHSDPIQLTIEHGRHGRLATGEMHAQRLMRALDAIVCQIDVQLKALGVSEE